MREMAENLYTVLPDRAAIAVSGADARSLLQGLVTNDVDRVGLERAIYAALLTPQGRYLFDFFIVELEGTLHLDCEAARRDELIKRLTLYKLRAKVSLTAADGLSGFAAFSGNAAAAVGLANEPGRACAFAGGVAYVDPRNAAAGVRVLAPADAAAAALDAAGVRRAEFADYDAMRVRLGLPESGRDMVAEKGLLLEFGFEALNGVDFEKGCYVGQEVTTRMKRRDLVKKLLMPVTIEGEAPVPGTKVLSGDVEAGELRSSRDGMGLALLRLDLARGGKALTAGAARIIPRAD
jgi:folate-binding protein YgfZ